MIESKIHFFKRLNLRENHETTQAFNSTHHCVFGDESGYPMREIERVKLDLLNKWNREGRGRWQYYL